MDENLPEEVVDELPADAHDATSVRQQGMSGADDGIISERIIQEERCLIPLDLGFGDMRKYPPSHFPGIIVIRTKDQDKNTILGLVRSLITKLTIEDVVGKLWVVESDRIRIRGEAN